MACGSELWVGYVKFAGELSQVEKRPSKNNSKLKLFFFAPARHPTTDHCPMPRDLIQGGSGYSGSGPPSQSLGMADLKVAGANDEQVSSHV